MSSFNCKWSSDSRVPKEVELPNGQIRQVQYMRDGLILFAGGSSAEYERISDNEARISLIQTREQAMVAARNYRQRVSQ